MSVTLELGQVEVAGLDLSVVVEQDVVVVGAVLNELGLAVEVALVKLDLAVEVVRVELGLAVVEQLDLEVVIVVVALGLHKF